MKTNQPSASTTSQPLLPAPTQRNETEIGKPLLGVHTSNASHTRHNFPGVHGQSGEFPSPATNANKPHKTKNSEEIAPLITEEKEAITRSTRDQRYIEWFSAVTAGDADKIKSLIKDDRRPKMATGLC